MLKDLGELQESDHKFLRIALNFEVLTQTKDEEREKRHTYKFAHMGNSDRWEFIEYKQIERPSSLLDGERQWTKRKDITVYDWERHDEISIPAEVTQALKDAIETDEVKLVAPPYTHISGEDDE